MDKPKDQPEEYFQRALTHRLRKTSNALQRLEQEMILTGHRSDQTALEMQKVREIIQSSLSDHHPLKKP